MSIGQCSYLIYFGISLLLFLLAISPASSSGSTDTSSGGNFFLKASKSVPRIGRRSDPDNYFLKASKSVPRMGRRRTLPPWVESATSDWDSWPWFRADNWGSAPDPGMGILREGPVGFIRPQRSEQEMPNYQAEDDGSAMWLSGAPEEMSKLPFWKTDGFWSQRRWREK